MTPLERKMVLVRRLTVVLGLALLFALLFAFGTSLQDGNSIGFSSGSIVRAAGSEWGYFAVVLLAAPFAIWAAIKHWK